MEVDQNDLKTSAEENTKAEALQPDCRWESFETPKRLALLDELNSRTVRAKNRQDAFDRLVKEINKEDISCRTGLMEELTQRNKLASRRSPPANHEDVRMGIPVPDDEGGVRMGIPVPDDPPPLSSKGSANGRNGRNSQRSGPTRPYPYPPYHPSQPYPPFPYPPRSQRNLPLNASHPSHPPNPPNPSNPLKPYPAKKGRKKEGVNYSWLIGALVSILLFAAYYDSIGRHSGSWTFLLLAFLVILLLSAGVGMLHHKASVEREAK